MAVNVVIIVGLNALVSSKSAHGIRCLFYEHKAHRLDTSLLSEDAQLNSAIVLIVKGLTVSRILSKHCQSKVSEEP